MGVVNERLEYNPLGLTLGFGALCGGRGQRLEVAALDRSVRHADLAQHFGDVVDWEQHADAARKRRLQGHDMVGGATDVVGAGGGHAVHEHYDSYARLFLKILDGLVHEVRCRHAAAATVDFQNDGVQVLVCRRVGEHRFEHCQRVVAAVAHEQAGHGDDGHFRITGLAGQCKLPNRPCSGFRACPQAAAECRTRNGDRADYNQHQHAHAQQADDTECRQQRDQTAVALSVRRGVRQRRRRQSGRAVRWW